MSGDHNETYQLLRMIFGGFGAVVGGVTVAARIVAALVAREATAIEKHIVEQLGPQFISREVLDQRHLELMRRMERIEQRLDALREKA